MDPPGPETPTAGSASPSYHVGRENGREISRYVPLTARNGFFCRLRPLFPKSQNPTFSKIANFFDQIHFLRKVGPPGPGNPTAGSASPRQCVGFQNGWEISRYVPLVPRNDFFCRPGALFRKWKRSILQTRTSQGRQASPRPIVERPQAAKHCVYHQIEAFWEVPEHSEHLARLVWLA